MCVLGVIIVTKRGRNGEEINQNSKKKNHGKIMSKENNIKKKQQNTFKSNGNLS